MKKHFCRVQDSWPSQDNLSTISVWEGSEKKWDNQAKPAPSSRERGREGVGGGGALQRDLSMVLKVAFCWGSVVLKQSICNWGLQEAVHSFERTGNLLATTGPIQCAARQNIGKEGMQGQSKDGVGSCPSSSNLILKLGALSTMLDPPVVCGEESGLSAVLTLIGRGGRGNRKVCPWC